MSLAHDAADFHWRRVLVDRAADAGLLSGRESAEIATRVATLLAEAPDVGKRTVSLDKVFRAIYDASKGGRMRMGLAMQEPHSLDELRTLVTLQSFFVAEVFEDRSVLLGWGPGRAEAPTYETLSGEPSPLARAVFALYQHIVEEARAKHGYGGEFSSSGPGRYEDNVENPLLFTEREAFELAEIKYQRQVSRLLDIVESIKKARERGQRELLLPQHNGHDEVMFARLSSIVAEPPFNYVQLECVKTGGLIRGERVYWRVKLAERN
jgi:hypothetical protein